MENLGRTIKNQICIQKKIKSGLKSENACYHAVQNLFLLVCCQNYVKIKIL
jgi:hypothetical protein